MPPPSGISKADSVKLVEPLAVGCPRRWKIGSGSVVRLPATPRPATPLLHPVLAYVGPPLRQFGMNCIVSRDSPSDPLADRRPVGHLIRRHPRIPGKAIVVARIPGAIRRVRAGKAVPEGCPRGVEPATLAVLPVRPKAGLESHSAIDGGNGRGESVGFSVAKRIVSVGLEIGMQAPQGDHVRASSGTASQNRPVTDRR